MFGAKYFKQNKGIQLKKTNNKPKSGNRVEKRWKFGKNFIYYR